MRAILEVLGIRIMDSSRLQTQKKVSINLLVLLHDDNSSFRFIFVLFYFGVTHLINQILQISEDTESKAHSKSIRNNILLLVF